jgi:ABC-type glycerol-3-phosphate transport system permease component
MSSPVIYIPKNPTLSNFTGIWKNSPLGYWYLNTVIVSVSATIIAMILSMFAGYGFSRFPIKGKSVLLVVILFANMFPACLIVIPYFVWMSKLKLINTYPGLIITYLSGALPFSIWMLKGFFDSIPKEMDEAAMIDGCNNMTAFFKVILPISAPGISAATLYSFLVAWNSYLYSLILVTKDKMMTLNVGITKFVSEAGVRWGEMNAMAIMTSLPIILAFIFFEKYIVTGISAGAVKG